MNLPYRLARLEGKIARAIYRAALPSIVRRPIAIPTELSFDVFAYSGEQTLPEQAASIRSFLANAGRPRSFTIVSDGSYSQGSIQLLEKIDRCVRVRATAPEVPPGLPENTETYLRTHPTGKQLALLMSLPVDGPALYTDSDVLFFPQATQLGDIAARNAHSAIYLADYKFSGDERLIRDPSESERPVNTGFVFLFEKLDWSRGVERLATLNGAPNFFTNQTVTHLALHANRAAPFNPAKFVLRVDDEFVYGDRYAASSLVMRHYVNQIRHKFWTPLARSFRT
ncbi:MAG TPA: hypothetical protein VFA58_06600 [Chthoniobacterales bacterium]|nr:hypothetical protein [Chthoniobacterales bacterium]